MTTQTNCDLCHDTGTLTNPYTREPFPCPICGELPPIRERPISRTQDTNATDTRVHLFAFDAIKDEELCGMIQLRTEGERLTVRVTTPGNDAPVEEWRAIDSDDPAVATFLTSLFDAMRDHRVRREVTQS